MQLYVYPFVYIVGSFICNQNDKLHVILAILFLQNMLILPPPPGSVPLTEGILNGSSTHTDLSMSSTFTTTHQGSQNIITAVIITVSIMLIVIFISTLVVVAVLKALFCSKKYKRKLEITVNNIGKIQCQNNSANQETKFKYKCEDKDIKCLENSAYGNVKHGVDHNISDRSDECLNSRECTKQLYRADNSQYLVSERNDYEECVYHNNYIY